METIVNSSGQPRSVDAGRGVGWWGDGWKLFMKNPGMCVVLGLILIVVFVALNFVPLVGGLAACLLTPPMVAGWMDCARKLESGATLEVGDLFSGFKDRLNPLLVLGALLVGAMLAILVICTALGFGAGFGMFVGSAVHSGAAAMMGMGAALLAGLIGLALFIPVSMAFWFAPGLVAFQGMQPMDALKVSFAGCLRNIVPFLLYGIVYFVAALVASIPFGLGWLVLIPVSLHTLYISYREILGG